jgi:hypothetical protein
MLVHRTSNPPPQIGSQESPDGRKKKVRINREKAAWRLQREEKIKSGGGVPLKFPETNKIGIHREKQAVVQRVLFKKKKKGNESETEFSGIKYMTERQMDKTGRNR